MLDLANGSRVEYYHCMFGFRNMDHGLLSGAFHVIFKFEGPKNGQACCISGVPVVR